MNQKKFINIAIIIGIVVITGITGYFILSQRVGEPTSGWDSSKPYFYYDENNYKNNLKFLRLSNDGEPVFLSSNENSELILGDSFYLKLESGAALQDLQNLNQKYNAVLEKEQDGLYILTVKNNPLTNALEMANLYHDEQVIQWAMPLWKKQHELR